MVGRLFRAQLAPSQGRRNRLRLRGRTLLVLAVLAYCSAVMVRAEWQIYQLRKDLAAVQAKREILTQRRQALEEELRRLGDPKYLERVAREELGLVRPGEVLVVPGSRLDSP